MEGQPESSKESMETQEAQDVPVVKIKTETEIQGFISFTEQLSKFYEHAEHVADLQNNILDMKNYDEYFKVIEEATVSLETTVDAIVVENDAKKKESGAVIMGYRTNPSFIEKQNEVGLLQKTLNDAFVANPTTSLFTQYVSDSDESKLRKMLEEVFESCQIANIKLTLPENDLTVKCQLDVNYQNDIARKFYIAARVFLILAKATTVSPEKASDDKIYDYKEALEYFQTDPKNEDLQDEVKQFISDLLPQFESLTSVDEQQEWILKAARETDRKDFVKNLKFVIAKTTGFSEEQNELFNKLETRKRALMDRTNGSLKKLKDSDFELGKIAGSKVSQDVDCVVV